MSEHQGATKRDSFNVAVFSRGFFPGFRGGGPIRSVTNLVREAPEGVRVRVFVQDRDFKSRTRYPQLSRGSMNLWEASVSYLDTGRISDWIRVARELRADTPDVIYVNSLWDRHFTWMPLVCWRIGVIPAKVFVIAPRGELHPGALRLKPVRKRMAGGVLSAALRDARVIWHATAELEATDIRSWSPEARVLVHPNMVDLPKIPAPPKLREREKLRIIFIGRISPKKGLLLAIQSMRLVTSDVRFDIWGPIEDENYWRQCRLASQGMPSNVDLRYRGELLHDDVLSEFAASDLFIFPTAGENFGHVIAESLSASCPVVIPPTTPWTRDVQQGGGWVVDPSPAAFAEIIDSDALATPAQRLEARRRAGSTYITWRSNQGAAHLFDALRLELSKPR